MTRYEQLLLFSPELGTEERQAVLDRLGAVVAREGGQMLAVDDWGMRDTAYPVRKFTRGHYVRLEMNLPGAAVAELERNVRISEGVLKFITVRLAGAPKEAEHVPA